MTAGAPRHPEVPGGWLFGCSRFRPESCFGICSALLLYASRLCWLGAEVGRPDHQCGGSVSWPVEGRASGAGPLQASPRTLCAILWYTVDGYIYIYIVDNFLVVFLPAKAVPLRTRFIPHQVKLRYAGLRCFFAGPSGHNFRSALLRELRRGISG